MKKDRVIYLDLIKGISIILVVFCHDVTLSQETILGNLVMSMAWGAVPCFMMVSGGLMHTQIEFDWKKYLSRISKIYFLIVFWKILYFVFFTRFKIHFTLIEILQYLFLFSSLPHINTGHFWFMYAYLSVLLIFPVSFFLFKEKSEGKSIAIFIMALAFLSGIFIPASNWILSVCSEMVKISFINVKLAEAVLPFTNYSNMLFYFILGSFLYQYRSIIEKRITIWIPLGMLFLGTLGLMLIKYITIGSFQWMGIYLEDGYSKLSTVLVSLGIYLLTMIAPIPHKISEPFARYIGESTMGIFYLHVPLLAVYNKFLYPFLQKYYSFSLNIVKTISVVIICCILTLCLKKMRLIKQLVK